MNIDDRRSKALVVLLTRSGVVRKHSGPITRRSQVQILPPLFCNLKIPFFILHSFYYPFIKCIFKVRRCIFNTTSFLFIIIKKINLNLFILNYTLYDVFLIINKTLYIVLFLLSVYLHYNKIYFLNTLNITFLQVILFYQLTYYNCKDKWRKGGKIKWEF